MANNLIHEVEKRQMKTDLPEFSSGDTVVVKVLVKEGTRTRQQAFEGVVIAKRNRGLNSSFTVRKISHGEGVERVFQTHSPLIKEIIIKRQGDVRKAKLYYLRERSGKSARIKEKLDNKKKIDKKGGKTASSAANTAGAASSNKSAQDTASTDNKPQADTNKEN